MSEENLTECAIRSEIYSFCLHPRTLFYFVYCRSFYEPQPSARIVADCVSNLCTAVQNSLRVGVVRNCSFVVPFRVDVFGFLFRDKGSTVRGKRGRMFSLADFNQTYFPSNWFVSHSRLGDGCKLDFPINLRNHVKFSPLTYFKDHNNDMVAIGLETFQNYFL